MPVVSAAPRSRADLGGVARSGSAGMVGAGVTAVLGAVFTIGVTRGVGAVEAGVFFSATSVFLLLYAIARLGTGTGAVYFLTRHRALGRPDRLRPTLRVALLPVTVLSVVLSAGLFVLAPAISDLIARGDSDAAVLPLRVLAGFVPLAALSDLFLAAARGFGRVRPLVLVDKVGRPFAQVAGLGVAVAAGWSVSVALPLVWAGPYLLSAAVAAVWLGRLVRRAERVGTPDVADGPPWREFWAFTGPRALGSVAQIALQRLDIVLVAALAGPAEAALYTAATRFLVFGQLGGTALGTGVQHRFGTLFATGDRAAAAELYRTSTAWLMVLTWPLYLLFAVFSPFVLALFGKGYAVAEPVMVLLALTMLVATGCGMVDNVLNMAGRTTWTLTNALLALALDVALNFLLVPRIGILGAAVAWAAAIAANNLLPLAQLGWSMGLHPFGRGTAVAAGLAVACFGALPLAAAVLAGRTLPVLIGTTVVGVALYGAGLWAARGPLRLSALRGIRRRPPPRGGAGVQGSGQDDRQCEG
jgi:O-antigen/teichoic acid export membrane protein